MKSIRADTHFLSVLILLTALSDVSGADGNQTTSLPTTSSGVLNTITGLPTTKPAHTTTKTENGSAATPPPMLPTTRPSDLTDIIAKNRTEVTTKASNTTDQYHPAITSSTVLPNVNLTTPSKTHATSHYVELSPTDERIDVNSTDGQNNVLESKEESSDKIKTKHTGTRKENGTDEEGEVKPLAAKSKNGIIIGVGCVVAAVVFVVLIFLYKMCQKKPPAAGNSEIKVSAQTKESVKLLSVKTATPYSDSKRMSSNHMESIEC